LRKVISLLLVLVIMLGCIGLVACGGEEESGTTPTNGEPTAPAEKETPSSGGGFTWDDMPVYPGATTDEGTWTSVTKDNAHFESHLYETNDSLSAVADFYKSEMPKNGWNQQGWAQVGAENAVGVFVKNNEQDTANVNLKKEGDRVLILLQRVHEDK
jgi:hypothetical protein